MTKRLVTAFILVLILAGLVGILGSTFDQLGCEGQLLNNSSGPTFEQEIREERIIGQSFIAPRAGLNRIDLLLQTYGRSNSGDVFVRLLEVPPGLTNPLEGREIFSSAFNAATVQDRAWRTFTFPPLAGSAGQTYLIALASPGSAAGNAIAVGGIERDLYPPGGAFLGPAPVPADITFRACFDMTAGERWSVLAGQVTQGRPGPWGAAAFYLLQLLVYAGLLLGFLWRLAAKIFPHRS